MKFLRKINKGLVLTIIILVVLVIYLINVEAKRNTEKPHIEEAIRSYVELIDRYAVMPEQYQKLYSNDISKEKIEEINKQFEEAVAENVSKFEVELNRVMIENEKAKEMQKKVLEDLLIENNDPMQSVTIKFDREITKINKYAFDDNQVTITFDSKIQTEVKYLDGEKELTKKNTKDAKKESMTLVYEDGIWKVVYADLSIILTNNSEMYVRIY